MKIEEMISRWLVAGYAYYKLGESLMLDSEYDELCEQLLLRLDEVKKSKHPHKSRVTKVRLKSGASNIRWPKIVQVSARIQLMERD